MSFGEQDLSSPGPRPGFTPMTGGASTVAHEAPSLQSLNPEGIIFYAYFTDGYALRQYFEFLRQSVQTAPLFVTAKDIRISAGNDRKTLQTSCVLRRCDLTRFCFNIAHASHRDAKTPYHAINYDLISLYGLIKTVAKKESVAICQHIAHPNFLFVLTGDRSSMRTSYIRTLDSEPTSYGVRDLDQIPSDCPNVTIPLSEWSGLMNDLGKTGSHFSSFKCYSRGMYIGSVSSNGCGLTQDSWGDISSGSDPHQSVDVPVTKDIVKALGKTLHFHDKGIVRVYARSDGLIRHEIPLSAYGLVTIYVMGGASA